MLIDSNIVIYSAQPDYAALHEFFAEHRPVVSAISLLEVLGFYNLEESDRKYFEDFFNSASIVPISNEILDQAVKLRQSRKMSLGDAIIAASALVHKHTLATANLNDFNWIADLSVVNPLESKDS